MKTRLALLVLVIGVLAGVSSFPATASPGPNTSVLARVKYVASSGGSNSFRVGATRFDVRSVIGVPDHEPSANVWIYHRFFADREDVNRLGVCNLVVIFDGACVSDIRLVNDRAVAVITAQLKTEPKSSPPPLLLAGM